MDERISSGAYRDDNDYLVDIGTHVGFLEVFCPDCRKPRVKGEPCGSYIVLDLPNLGNTVIMTEIVYFGDETGRYFLIDPNETIEVEPWKIGAI